VHFCKGNQLTVSTAQHSNVRAVPNPSEKRALHAAGFASQRASEQADKAPSPGAYGVPCVRDRYRARSHAPSSAHARDPSRRPSVSCSCSHPVSASTAWGSWAPVLIGAGSLATALYGYISFSPVILKIERQKTKSSSSSLILSSPFLHPKISSISIIVGTCTH
jgi:hypothetical protein